MLKVRRGIDGLSPAGAIELARMIEEYWRHEGWLVRCVTMPLKVTDIAKRNRKTKKEADPIEIGEPVELADEAKTKPSTSTSNVWGVRSDMLNGLPIERLPTPALARIAQ